MDFVVPVSVASVSKSRRKNSGSEFFCAARYVGLCVGIACLAFVLLDASYGGDSRLKADGLFFLCFSCESVCGSEF
jgi:hypothetical protein